MGTAERKEKHRKKVRADILETARKIAALEGWPAVSVRRIAERIDYTPPILYEYFASREHLLEAVREEGFRELETRFGAIKNLYRNPEKQLMEVAACIWNYALSAPEVFQVMFNLEGAYCSSRKAYGGAFDSPQHPVWEMLAAIRPRFAEAVSRSCHEWWAVTYGFIALMMTVKTREELTALETTYMEHVRRYLRGLL